MGSPHFYTFQLIAKLLDCRGIKQLGHGLDSLGNHVKPWFLAHKIQQAQDSRPRLNQ